MLKRLGVMVTAFVALGAFTACERSRQKSEGASNIEAPAALVAEYLTRDARGERLQRAAWFRSVSAWEDEPAWDSITLIRSFRVGRPSTQADTARMEVTYEVVGSLEGTPQGTPMNLVPREDIQRVEFVLARAQGHWLVAFPSINPHVLAESILVYRPGILSRGQAGLLDSLLRAKRN